MIESELPPPADDPGPPVLLKRLGNAVEANLAKNKLATAGLALAVVIGFTVTR